VRPYLVVRPSLTEGAKMRPGGAGDLPDFSAISQKGVCAPGTGPFCIHSGHAGAQ